MPGLAERINDRHIIVLVGVAIIPLLAGSFMLYRLLPGVSTGNQAVAIGTAMGAFGTLALAIATFLTILQNNATLEYRKKEVKEPLVIDEISNFIQPGINTLESNLEPPNKDRYDGCSYEWNYIDPDDLIRSPRRPDPIVTKDSVAVARMVEEERELVEQIKKHNEKIKKLAKRADPLVQHLRPEIQDALKESGRDEDDESDIRVITSSVIKKVDGFGESSELYDFWEEYGDSLVESAENAPTITVNELKSYESEYEEIAQRTLEQLGDRKTNLKREFGIPEDAISAEEHVLSK